MKNKLVAFFFILIVGGSLQGQDILQPKHLFTTPKNYVVPFTSSPPIIDGNINDEIWERATWSAYFEDIEGSLKSAPYKKTRVKMLWDKQYLYIAADLEESHIWSYLQQRDTIVYHDNDFEIFIDPYNTTHQYFEIEINARNTIFDLFMPKPYRNGSDAIVSWDTPGMLHAVQLNGSLNNSNDTDKSWTVEIAIPFSALTIGYHPRIPKTGDIWRINFSRVQWETDIVDGNYVKQKDANGRTLPENNWVWSPQGVINMHFPERWGYLQFSEVEAGLKLPEFKMPFSEEQKQYLWLVYYKQKEFYEKNKRYASLTELKIQPKVKISNRENIITVETGNFQFVATITANNDKCVINQDGLVRVITNK